MVTRPVVLLQTVGTGGDGYPVWKALATIVRKRRPAILVQLCSGETLEQTVPKFDAELGKVGFVDSMRRIELSDVDDVSIVTNEIAVTIEHLREEFPGHRFECDFTSGTKAMSAALVAAAVAHEVPELHYATGARDSTGRVTRTTDTRSVSGKELVAGPRLAELGRLFNAGQYGAVRMQAESLKVDLRDDVLSGRAETVALLSRVYERWDRFEWGRAREILKAALEQTDRLLREARWDVSRLHGQVRHLHRCNDGRTRPERLADILANVDRRIERARYDDALARLYRLIEYVGQGRLEREHPINDTSRVDRQTLQSLAPNSLKRMPANGDTLKLGLRNNIEVLAEAGDPVGLEMKRLYEFGLGGRHRRTMQQLLDERNNSFLAHGKRPVGAEVPKSLRECAARILSTYAEYYDGTKKSTGAESLEGLLQNAVFLRCPWVREVG